MAAALVLIALLTAPPSPAADAPLAARAAEAIRRAVSARMQVDGIAVEGLVVTVVPHEGRLVARPAPDVRTGHPGRFALTAFTPDGPRRVGSAEAIVQVSAPALRTVRDLARGRVVEAQDVAVEEAAVRGVPLEPLPSLAELVGARTRRALPAGSIVTADAVRLLPLVQSGQPVVVRALVGRIEARGTAVALQNGRAGDAVLVVNPESRRRIRARVTGPGEVEVIHGS